MLRRRTRYKLVSIGVALALIVPAPALAVIAVRAGYGNGIAFLMICASLALPLGVVLLLAALLPIASHSAGDVVGELLLRAFAIICFLMGVGVPVAFIVFIPLGMLALLASYRPWR